MLVSGKGSMSTCGVCVFILVLCVLTSDCMWGGVCGCVALSSLACLTKERVGAFCECVWVSVCDAPSIPNSGIKGAGLPLFSGGGGCSRTRGEGR